MDGDKSMERTQKQSCVIRKHCYARGILDNEMSSLSALVFFSFSFFFFNLRSGYRNNQARCGSPDSSTVCNKMQRE